MISRKRDALISFVLSALIVLYLIMFASLRFYDDVLYASSGNSILAAMGSALAQTLAHREVVVGAAVLLVAIFTAGCLYFSHKERVNEFLFRYRYPIALVILVLAVIFEISGSSIGQWAMSLPEGTNDGLLLGRPRGCRTDEYALFTGMTFAQYYDPQGSWPYFGEVLRATTTDMFMVYGQPVADLAILVRPFQIGYLVLGLSKGLSFFWASRAIALFMSAFEFGRTITDDNRPLSIAFAALSVFAPAVAWWFSINSFVEMLVCFNVINACFFNYLREDSRAKRGILLAACAYCMVVFVFSIYPAWQIPLLYVLLAMIVARVIGDRKGFISRLAQDKFIWIGCVVVAAAVGAYIGIHSLDAILAEISTDYPGDRIDCGGGLGLFFFRSPLSLFLPFLPPSSDSGLAVGLPDVGTAFNEFFPLGIVLFAFNSVRRKKIDPVPAALCVVILLLGVYIAVGLPEPIAKVTLLGKSIPSRAIVIFSFANLILLFYELARFTPFACGENGMADSKRAALVVAGCVGASLILAFLCKLNDVSFVAGWRFVVVAAVLLAVLLSVAFGRRRAFVFLCVAVALVAGGLVNPLQKGISVVDENPLVTEMRSLSDENEDSKWLATVDWMSNMTLFAGAPSVNSTNIYPNAELWAILDPEGQYKSEWNRYAHLPCHLVSAEEGHSFKRTSLDTIEISLTLDDLDSLGVDFIVSNEEPNLSQEEMARLEVVYTNGAYRIYRLV